MKSWKITALILCLTVMIFIFSDCSDKPELTHFDLIENFFLADTNFSITEEELAKILTTPVMTSLSVKQAALIEKTLTDSNIIKNASDNSEIRNTAFRIVYPYTDSRKFNTEIQFRKTDNYHYSLLFNGSTKVTLKKYTRQGEVAVFETDLKKFPETRKLSLHIVIYENHLMIYEAGTRMILVLSAKLDHKKAGGVSVEVSGDGFNKHEPLIKYSKLQPDDEGFKKIFAIYSESYHFNRFYPEHRIPIEGDTSAFLQRFDQDFLTMRSIILPEGSEIEYDIKIPDQAFFDFSLFLSNKNLIDPSRAVLEINIDDSSGKNLKQIDVPVPAEKFEAGQWIYKKIQLHDLAGVEGTLRITAIGNHKKTVFGKYIFILGNPVLRQRRLKDDVPVILISIDTLKPDHLSLFGYKRPTSPNLDKLAEGGVVFMNAVSSATWTLPGHISILSGLYPSEAGYRQIRLDSDMQMWQSHRQYSRLAPEVNTLAERMKAAGYSTFAYTGGGLVDPKFDFDQGFEGYSWKGLDHRDAKMEIDDTILWLRNNQNRKFFLFFHTYEVHDPYTRRYFTDYKRGDSTGEIIANYDSGIQYADEHLGRFFDELKRLGLDEKSLIIVTSDHGENFDKDFIRKEAGSHGRSLYDTELKVPIIIKAPGLLTGQKINNQVRTVDILPTVLDYLGIEYEPDIRGASLLPIIRGEKTQARVAFAEAVVLSRDVWDRTAIRTDENKLIKNIPDKFYTNLQEYEFYNLKEDSEERNDIFSKESNFIKRFVALLNKISSDVKKRGADIPIPNLESGNSQDREFLEQLKALNYIGGN
ncbi:MAG: sulfatase [Acidobacteria bacterium]|nr:sulfatase [Acidobacteriota bacterium]